MRVLESAENYLESILVLKRTLGEVRAVDIANHLGFSKPSVSVAMKLLREQGLVTINQNNFLSLTPKGLEIASSVNEKHELLTQFLLAIGVSEACAKADACRIEHHISDESYEKLKKHAQQVLSKKNTT